MYYLHSPPPFFTQTRSPSEKLNKPWHKRFRLPPYSTIDPKLGIDIQDFRQQFIICGYSTYCTVYIWSGRSCDIFFAWSDTKNWKQKRKNRLINLKIGYNGKTQQHDFWSNISLVFSLWNDNFWFERKKVGKIYLFCLSSTIFASICLYTLTVKQQVVSSLSYVKHFLFWNIFLFPIWTKMTCISWWKDAKIWHFCKGKQSKFILCSCATTVVVDAFPTMYVSLGLSFSHSFAAGTVSEYSKAPGRRF